MICEHDRINLELHFVGWFKHGEVQHFVAGPFLQYEDASEKLASLNEINNYRIVQVLVPAIVNDIHKYRGL